jgi:neutral ceramidase
VRTPVPRTISPHRNGFTGGFFSSHSFFLGYCDGYHQYSPTIEAASEGGYGPDGQVSPVEIGAGETMINKALLWMYQLRDKIK